MKPLGDKIIVKPLPREMLSGGGIVIPGGLDDGCDMGIVIAKADQVGDYLLEGTRVMYSRNGVQTFEHEGEELVSLSEMSVLAAMDDFNAMDDS